jgi:hypothetical protein
MGDISTAEAFSVVYFTKNIEIYYKQYTIYSMSHEVMHLDAANNLLSEANRNLDFSLVTSHRSVNESLYERGITPRSSASGQHF